MQAIRKLLKFIFKYVIGASGIKIKGNLVN